jgi:hypothetical protein
MTGASSSDHLYTNEIPTVGRRGWLWPDSCYIAEIERPSTLRVASCRPMMAPDLAPRRRYERPQVRLVLAAHPALSQSLAALPEYPPGGPPG